MAEQKVNNGNEVTATKYVAAIFSQTVGTFHTNLTIGGRVTVGDCIGSIEQLGTTSDVITQISGEVVTLLVQNAKPVEFGQPIVLIKPAGALQPVHSATNCHVAAPKMAKRHDPTLKDITALLPGTFYAAPAPNAAPYVVINSSVTTDQPVCIIEAMKTFNEILAPVRGTIVEILVANGESVVKDQVLFRIKPDGS